MSAQPQHIHSVPPPPLEASDYEMVRGTRRAISLLSGKWSVEVLYLLASGTRRYSEVLHEVGEISKKTLTQTLRTLEREGLVSRRPYPEVPPRVEYSLTSLGWSVTALLMALYEWSAEHLADSARPQRHTFGVAPHEPAPLRSVPNP
ncbi:MAG: putative HTH-type transcriptional regulator YtfH [Solirubrobacterales bacterium]|nr:putative HTH-type transcriptional regulator YtfH [Solirubrobacterales bacterium]